MYTQYLMRKTQEYGAKFDPSELAPQFQPYLHTGQRIRVRFSHGEKLTGTIGVTTGWKPCFMLLRCKSDIGSAYLLHEYDKIVAIKIGHTYWRLG